MPIKHACLCLSLCVSLCLFVLSPSQSLTSRRLTSPHLTSLDFLSLSLSRSLSVSISLSTPLSRALLCFTLRRIATGTLQLPSQGDLPALWPPKSRKGTSSCARPNSSQTCSRPKNGVAAVPALPHLALQCRRSFATGSASPSAFLLFSLSLSLSPSRYNNCEKRRSVEHLQHC